MAWEQIAYLGFRCLGPVISAYRRWQRKPAFAERSGSGWRAGKNGERCVLHLRGQLTLTNQSARNGLLVVRVQVARSSFIAFWQHLEDCHFCDIGEDRVGAPLTPGVPIPARTAMPMQVAHPFTVKALPRQRTKRLSFRIVVTDQFGDRHSKRLKLGMF
jgi:hypothetical protein